MNRPVPHGSIRRPVHITPCAGHCHGMKPEAGAIKPQTDYRDNAGAGRSISACVTSLSATYLPNTCATR